MAENKIVDIKAYLDCSTQELMEVWKEMSEKEKEQWKTEELPKK